MFLLKLLMVWATLASSVSGCYRMKKAEEVIEDIEKIVEDTEELVEDVEGVITPVPVLSMIQPKQWNPRPTLNQRQYPRRQKPQKNWYDVL